MLFFFFFCSIILHAVTLPKPTVARQSVSQIWKIGRRRHRFWQNFWSADDFFVEAPKLKVSLTDPPIFRGFVIGEASGDDRSTIGRFFHHDIGRKSPDHRASIGRRSADGRSMTFYQRTVGRQTPDIDRRPIINFELFYIVYTACIHIIYEIISCIYFILGFISFGLVYK